MNNSITALCVGVALALHAVFVHGADLDRAPQVVRISIDAAGERSAAMVAGVYLPAGDGPFPVLIYAHGRSGTEQERYRTRLPDPRGHVRYWLGRGFAVVATIRPGYGESGGIDEEDSGVRYDVFGNCWGRADFARSADAASGAVLRTLGWVRTQPWADAQRIVLAGVSMGGLASIASAARNPPGVVAYINFSGGTGGNGTRPAEHTCGLETMASLMAAYGRRTHVPGLWLYAANDSYWGAEWPRAWHQAYAAGGTPTEFVMTSPVPGADGHQLLTRGSRLWSSYVDRFLGELGF